LEVWDEDYLAVAIIADEGMKLSKKSPLQIVRDENLLALRVPAEAGARTSSVDLELRVPARARLKISTNEGDLTARGVSSFLSVQTISGAISVELQRPLDADLTAQSLNGTLALGEDFAGGSSPGAPPQRGKWRARLGAGSRVVNLFSGRGLIQLATLNVPIRDAVADAPSSAIEATTTTTNTTIVNLPPKPVATIAPRAHPPSLLGVARPPTTTAGAAGALPSGPQEIDPDEIVRIDTGLVTLNVSVIDRASGRGFADLRQPDFRLFEDGQTQEITQFEAAAAPFDLVLLLDLSGSTARVTDLIRAATLRFINAARPQDRIAIITFAGEPKLVHALTSDRQVLRVSVDQLRSPQGDTKLYDALNFALEFLDHQTAAPQRRRAVVLMSDGLDSTLPNVTGEGSTLAYAELRRRVQEFDGVLYTLYTAGAEYEALSPLDIQPETFDLAFERMEELAEAGGGVFHDVEKLEDLAGAYERVIADLGTLYSLSYRPTNSQRDNSWRAIRIQLPHHPGAVARGKRGYYAK
nr:VWA domain-containing protein [Pyrinomonadaceae bacterium]